MCCIRPPGPRWIIYAERLFLFISIGPLGAVAASTAIGHPIEAGECSIGPQAIARIIAVTDGYPYFLQEWGKQCWNAAVACPITADDVEPAHPTPLSALDDSFFRVRLNHLTPSEKRYLRGMADPGEGPFCSTAIAEQMGRKSSGFGPVRASLIAKGKT